jgi:hypothetical protein
MVLTSIFQGVADNQQSTEAEWLTLGVASSSLAFLTDGVPRLGC